MPTSVAPNVPTGPEFSLNTPRPLSHALFPLQEEHVLGLLKHSEGGTKLPTTLEGIVQEHGIHSYVAAQHRIILEEVASVYNSAKEHSVAHRGGVSDLILELDADVIRFAEDFEAFYPKLHNYLHYYHSKEAVERIIERLSFAISSMILKAAHIADVLGETNKSVNYGQIHINRVHEKAGGLLKHTNVQGDMDKLSEGTPATLTTMLTLQGGLGRTLVNLNMVKAKVNSGIFNAGELTNGKSSAHVVSTWTDLKEKVLEHRKVFG